MAAVIIPDGKLFIRFEEVMMLCEHCPIVDVNRMEGELEAAVYRALLHSLRLSMGQRVQEFEVQGRDYVYTGFEEISLLNRDIFELISYCSFQTKDFGQRVTSGP